MATLLRMVFPISAGSGIVPVWRAITLYTGIVIFAAARVPLVIPDVLQATAQQLDWSLALTGALNALLLLLALLIYVLVRRQQFLLAALALSALLLADAALLLLAADWTVVRGWAALWVGLTLGWLLLRWQQAALISGLSIIIVLISGLLSFNDLSTSQQTLRVAGVLAVVAWIASLSLMIALLRHGEKTAVQTRYDQDAPRQLMEIGAEVAQGLFQRAELDTLLQQIASSLQARFHAIDHAQIFLVESGSDHAVLHAASGAVGEQLVTQEYRVPVGGLSVVGRVTISGSHLLIADYNLTPIHKPHALLPETRSELALPLLVNEDIVGALSVQSQQINAFDEADVAFFKAIANQVAIAVDGLQLYASAQRSSRQNQALFQQTQASLREIERLNYQITGRAWSDYLRLQGEDMAFTLNLQNGQTVPSEDWTPTLLEAASRKSLTVSTEESRRVVSLPLIVRNEVVGAMEFELLEDSDPSAAVLEMVEAVGERLGLAMENRRLFDETQRAVQREALINDVGAELQAATGVDAIVQRAAQHLQQALSAQRVTIRLGEHDPAQETAQP